MKTSWKPKSQQYGLGYQGEEALLRDKEVVIEGNHTKDPKDTLGYRWIYSLHKACSIVQSIPQA